MSKSRIFLGIYLGIFVLFISMITFVKKSSCSNEKKIAYTKFIKNTDLAIYNENINYRFYSLNNKGDFFDDGVLLPLEKGSFVYSDK